MLDLRIIQMPAALRGCFGISTQRMLLGLVLLPLKSLCRTEAVQAPRSRARNFLAECYPANPAYHRANSLLTPAQLLELGSPSGDSPVYQRQNE